MVTALVAVVAVAAITFAVILKNQPDPAAVEAGEGYAEVWYGVYSFGSSDPLSEFDARMYCIQGSYGGRGEGFDKDDFVEGCMGFLDSRIAD